MFDPNSTIGSAIGHLRLTAADLLRFLKAPSLAAREEGQAPAWPGIFWLFILNCLIVAAIALVIFPAMMLLEVEMSSGMSGLFDRPVWQVLAIIVVVAPILEELAFRSWLSGTPRLLVPVGGLLAWIGASALLGEAGFSMAESWAHTALLVGIFVGVLFALVRMWNRAAPGWYARIFPFIFWTQALLFGLVHLFNYAGDNMAILLPFVLPQLVGGLIWGYARIRYGWWSNILMHMGYNLFAASGILYVMLSGGTLV